MRLRRRVACLSSVWLLVHLDENLFSAAKGVTADQDIVAYCRIGERSSHTWFVLHELLGYENVRNYDGSWTEWGSMINMPIENPSAG